MGFSTIEHHTQIQKTTAVSSDVGDAVGISPRYWFVAIMRRNNTEKASAEQLRRLGYDCYVATQEEYRVWRNGRRARIERVVIPSVVFVHCSEQERRRIVNMPFVSRFMTDRAAGFDAALCRPLAIVPEAQIRRLRFMLGESDSAVSFVNRYVKGQRVRVVRGRLGGLEGEIAKDADGRSRLYVRVDLCGCACLEIDPVNVEPIE